MTQQYIEDNSSDHKYFTITPQLVWALCRNVYDKSLWDTVKMIAGDSGECWVNTEDLGTLAMMSAGQCSQSRSYLLSVGLLQGEQKRVASGQMVWHLKVPDLWRANILWREALGDSLKLRVEWKALQKSGTLKFESVEDMLARLDEISNIELPPEKSLHTVKPSYSEGQPSYNEGKPSRGETKKNQQEKPVVNPKEEEEAKNSVKFFTNYFGELTRVQLDENGDEIPYKWNKKDPLWLYISQRVAGNPKNLQGGERKAMDDLMNVANTVDVNFGDWLKVCADEVKNKGEYKTLATFLVFATHGDNYELWKRGEYPPKEKPPERPGNGRVHQPGVMLDTHTGDYISKKEFFDDMEQYF
ncbi:MAG: hypothetical protein FOGNACKC_01945 [Anaerolineae bacterium]|nr:hypothetical protein [Anaerolineae bacterium]